MVRVASAGSAAARRSCRNSFVTTVYVGRGQQCQLPPPKKGGTHPNFSIVAKQLDGSGYYLVRGRPRPSRHCARWGPSFPHGERHNISHVRQPRATMSPCGRVYDQLNDFCTMKLRCSECPYTLVALPKTELPIGQ